jgi:hypothetical protein
LLFGGQHDGVAKLAAAFHAPIGHPPETRSPGGVDIASDLLPLFLRGGAEESERAAPKGA